VQDGRQLTTWEWFRDIYPVEDRPEVLQNEQFVNSLQPPVFMDMMRAWGELQKRNDKGEDAFRKDLPPPTKQFDGGPDNCADLLHPSRYFQERDVKHAVSYNYNTA
jgi:hypothetical protein